MLKEVKRRNVANKTQQNLNTTTLASLTTQKESCEKFVNDTEMLLKQLEESKKQKLAQITNDINNAKSLIEQYNKNINIANKKLKQLENQIDVTADFDSITKLSANIAIYEHEIEDFTKKMSTLDGQAECPLCGTKLTAETLDKHLEYIKNEIKTITADKAKLSKELDEVTKRYHKILDNKKLYDLIIVKKSEQEVSLQNAKSNLSRLESALITTQEAVTNIDVQSYTDELNKTINRISKLTTEMNVIDDNMKFDAILIDILGDDGLKTFFFKQLIPQLNNSVNSYLSDFNLNAAVEFDTNLDAKISQGKYTDCDYMGFSGGERARIDMAILLSFFDISRQISNWSCNVLFIDEVMDSGVDDEGIEQFITTLYNIVNARSKNDLGIYLISHKLADTDVAWKNVIRIAKNNGFSELEVIQNESSIN